MKERLDDQTIALRVAKELQDGWYVNLGMGIPTLVSNFVPEGRTVFFQAENGLLGYGPIATPERANELGWLYVNAAAQPVLPQPGMCIFDYAEAFDMIRGGHLDLIILGGLQVSERGDLANWRIPTYTGRGGTIANTERWGKRKLAYPIKHSLEGNYVLIKCKLKPASSRELEANLGISEEVLRHLLVKLES